MKILILVIGILGLVGCNKSETVDLKKQEDLQSYAIGQQVGNNLKNQSIPLNVSAVAAGIRDAINDTPQISKEEIQKALIGIQQEIMKKNNEQVLTNSKKGKEFLEANKTKHPQLKVLPSGVQVLVQAEGQGKLLTEKSKVKLNYTGKLIDGQEFDSSFKKNMPLQITVEQAFPGWKDALLLMRQGGKYTVFVPAERGYGRSTRPGIPPGSTLIYEMEVVEAK